MLQPNDIIFDNVPFELNTMLVNAGIYRHASGRRFIAGIYEHDGLIRAYELVPTGRFIRDGVQHIDRALAAEFAANPNGLADQLTKRGLCPEFSSANGLLAGPRQRVFLSMDSVKQAILQAIESNTIFYSRLDDRDMQIQQEFLEKRGELVSRLKAVTEEIEQSTASASPLRLESLRAEASGLRDELNALTDAGIPLQFQRLDFAVAAPGI